MAARKTKKLTKKSKATRTKKALRKVPYKGNPLIPARGRFHIFNLQSMSQYTDESNRLFIACHYSDGTTRLYSMNTIIKNRAAITRVLGTTAVALALSK